MKVERQHRIRRGALLLLAASLLAGCAPNRAYHVVGRGGEVCHHAPEAPECLNSYYQDFGTHDVAFVEFTERGNAFSDEAVEDVLRRIGDKARTTGVVVLAFVHGWKHNASEEDGNVKSLKAVLQTMGQMLGDRFRGGALGDRRLVGLYVGWRGASVQAPFIEELTFWDRKAVAEELGSGGVTRLLLDLDEATASNAENVLVIIGHSFGGAIVVRALTDILAERVTNTDPADGGARTFGDGVLVLNPAIEANQALPLVEAAIKRAYPRSQLPMFISLSSDADSATHYAFPVGQAIGLWNWRQTDLQRAYYYDRQNPDETMPLRERHLDATTVGNFAPFLTHRLTARASTDDVEFGLVTCEEAPSGCEPRGWTSLTGQPAIRNLPEHYPLYFIKTDASVIPDHNGIFNREVSAFVFAIIDDVIRRSLSDQARGSVRAAAEAGPPLLGEPPRFISRMREIWRVMPDGSESPTAPTR